MFKEKYLIQLELSTTQRLGKILNPMESLADSSKAAHDNSVSGPWNDEMVKDAEKATISLKDVMDKTRENVKKVFWDIPTTWAKELTGTLAMPVIKIPAWIYSKTMQPILQTTYAAASGLLVSSHEVLNKLLQPTRTMVDIWNKLDHTLHSKGGGHGAASAASGH